jgi:amino acid adenylation domain-containing protein
MSQPSTSMLTGPHCAIGSGETAVAKVLRRVYQSPGEVAVDRPDRQLTYADVAAEAGRISGALANLGIRPGTIVPIFARPGTDVVTATLGVLFAGCAYTVLDPHWPSTRVADIVAAAGSVLAVDATGGDAHTIAAVPLPALVGARAPAFTYRRGRARDIACVFFTSGSTGGPKGVLIPHRALVRTFCWGGFGALDRTTRIPQLAPPFWDASALETLGVLMNGGTSLVPNDRWLTGGELRRLVRSRAANAVSLTASVFNLLVEEDLSAFAGLRRVWVGGERLSVDHVRRFIRRHPGIAVTNCYGPVESMLFASTHPIRPVDLDQRDGIPIGRPIRNTTLLVLDGQRIVPSGVAGELAIAGDGLAAGFLDRSGPDPARFDRCRYPDGSSHRIYRTGDYVRLEPSGVLSYLGRRDRQVKLRGHRIEAFEVERAVAATPGVSQAVLVPHRDASGAVEDLVCFYTTVNGCRVGVDEVRRGVAAVLPAHLRPARYCPREALPLGPTGKLDLARLRIEAAEACSVWSAA